MSPRQSGSPQPPSSRRCPQPPAPHILAPTSAARGRGAIETRIRVRLTPRAARDEIAGWQGDLLRVRVAASPVDGKANAALERLLAEALHLPKRAVRIVAGVQSREKTVLVEGLARAELRRRLGGTGAAAP